MYSLNTALLRLIPVAFTLVGFGSSIQSAEAQTTFPFDTVYDTVVTLTPINTDVSQALIVGFNPNAPYGLTNFRSFNNYSRIDPTTGNLVFVQDASRFGLSGLPIGGEEFSGNGADKLFGNSTATAAFDFPNNTLSGTGTINITGGAGRFSGASGILNFTEVEPLNEDPTAPLIGKAFLKGSFQIPQQVPEPATNAALIGIGMIAIWLRHKRKLS
ncbi:hypothetical protein NIES4071_86140 [Calothrix sp. NIES-4071]|nr:hypothetical protein NIES4071_86140 [Calothrix sp. NIES-4071]BAZ62881.1 hypothetical protein NIES4105_86070 [Calothrix sp. NIES-4105]